MQNLLGIILGVILVATCFSACTSDEPNGNPNGVDARGDSAAVDSVVVDSLDMPNEHQVWLDTVRPVYADAYVPYRGAIEPLSADIRPIFTKNKRWLVWSKNGMTMTAFNDIFYYDESQTNSHGDKCVHTESNNFLDRYFVEDGSMVYVKVVGAGAGHEKQYHPYYDCYMLKSDFDDINSCDGYTDKIDWTIESRGTIVLCGKTRRATKVVCDDFVDYWVEGIGSLKCTYIQPDYLGGMNAYTHYTHTILECWDGNEKIYDAREFSHSLYTPIDVF